MKKYLKILIVASLLGGILAFLFFKDLNKEVIAITTKDNNIYIFQVGVFKNLDNANNFTNNFTTSLIYQDEEYYRVIVGIASNNKNKEKLEKYFEEKKINYYIKQKRVDKNYLKDIKEYEDVLIKTDKDEVIENVNSSILKEFNNYLKEQK